MLGRGKPDQLRTSTKTYVKPNSWLQCKSMFILRSYMYMVLIGYDPSKITILTTYNGQKLLIRDIISRKCAWHSLFRKPSKITTVDKFQGQQNDYILLSMVRTEYVGYLRDIRRIIVNHIINIGRSFKS